MMWKFKQILAVIDPTCEEQKALRRAIHLAKANQSNVTAFLSIYDFSYEMTTMLSAEERESMRSAVIEDRVLWIKTIIYTLNPGIEIDIQVLWHNRPYEAIIRTVQQGEYDTVIKGTHEHDKLKSVIFTPTDWHLMRKCPVPVLMVKEHAWPENGHILAAVNAGTEEEDHQSLNQKITEEARHLAELIRADVHLVNAYPGTPINIAIEIPEFDPEAYHANVKEHHTNALNQHAESHGIDKTRTHLHEGLPEDVIPKVAKEIDAELVIIGTVGRTGFSAALIGNTAEHVIDRLNCDILAIKPQGFECPIK